MIAFAATMVSIILSVLAIFLSILSNDSIGGMLHKVRDMYDAVSGIPNSLEQSVSELKEASMNVREGSSSPDYSEMEELKKQVNN